MVKNKKIVLVAILVIILLGVIVMLFLKNKDAEQIEENINEEELRAQFYEKFNNQENEYVSTLYNIQKSESGKYTIEANIPYVHIIDEIDNKVNKEINDIFVTKLLEVVNTSKMNTIFKIDYTVNIDNKILSMVIKCTLKEGNNAQRTIIKTYNYNLENNQKIEVLDLIPEEKRENIQNKINQEIQRQIDKENTIIELGYPVYRREAESDIYILKNATEFYIENNILYIIYCYGNNNYTSEVDLIINKV